MSLFRSLALAVVCALTLGSSAARAYTAGVEAGGTGTASQNIIIGNTNATTGSFGIILEQPFHLIPLLSFGFFEDFQTPIFIQTGSTSGAASYWVISAGARLGLDLGLLIPYVGIVGQLLILSSTPEGSPALNDFAWALGGDIGLDVSLVIFKIGLELRYLGTLSNLPVNSINPPSSVQIIQLLGSARISF
jgi:hypothetical protein